MLIVEGYAHVPEAARGAVLAIGNFDGVHRGHQALIEIARETGRTLDRPFGALVFEPHPRAFFRPEEPHFRLVSKDLKLRIFEEMGLDTVVVLPFDKDLASLTAEAFIKTILVEALAVRHVVVGYHFFFGKGRTGTAETLQAAGEQMGFGVTVVPPVADAGEAFSSTAIRLKLAEGNVAAAARMLGRPWQVSGTVVGGAKRGTGMGYPTANFALPAGTALGHGIYAVRVRLGERTIDGAAYLGTRPSFDNGAALLEVFLFDFDEDIYGQMIEVSFVERIRGDRKFASVEELVRQMDADCAKAREILAVGHFGRAG